MFGVYINNDSFHIFRADYKKNIFEVGKYRYSLLPHFLL